MRFFPLLLLAFCLCACESKPSASKKANHEHHHGNHKHQHDGHHGHHDHNKSNHLMNKRSFEDLVNAFESEDRSAYQKPEAVIEKLMPLKDKKVMDIGAGTGYFAFRLVDKGAIVIAADVDDRFLDYMGNKRESLGIDEEKMEIRLVPYNSPALKKNEVDVVLIVNTYHHIEERPAYFKQVFEGIKQGGKLMIVDFKKKKTPHGPPPDHRISGQQVIQELQDVLPANAEVLTDIKTLPEQYVITVTKP